MSQDTVTFYCCKKLVKLNFSCFIVHHCYLNIFYKGRNLANS